MTCDATNNLRQPFNINDAVAQGDSGALYFGANFEFAASPPRAYGAGKVVDKEESGKQNMSSGLT